MSVSHACALEQQIKWYKSKQEAGSMNEITGNISMEALEQLVEGIVRRVLSEQGEQQSQPKQQPRLLTATDLCKALKISRATLYNWCKKGSVMYEMLHPCIEKKGKAVLYDIEKVKIVIERCKDYMGRGREYGYKEQTNEAVKRNEEQRYRTIFKKLLSHRSDEVTEDEKRFYREQCLVRKVHCVLDNPMK